MKLAVVWYLYGVLLQSWIKKKAQHKVLPSISGLLDKWKTVAHLSTNWYFVRFAPRYATFFLLRPKVAKKHLQEYILPLRFYGEVCYVCFRICCILLVIYILKTQELQLPLSQNFYLNIFSFMYIRYINFLFYICTFTLFSSKL